MHKFQQFTSKHPVAFGFLIILLYSLLSTLTWPITQIYPFPEGNEIGGAIAKLLIAGCFMLVLWGLGWLRQAGFVSPGGRRIWGLAILLIAYNAICGAVALTGGFQTSLPSLELTLAILLFALATSLLEESLVRGLLLTAMVKAWGSTRRGIFAAAIFSGLIFACLHFFNLLVRPFTVVALQVLSMTIVGFMYAAIVLAGKSIWPVIFCHWLINTWVGLQTSQIPDFEETTRGWIFFALVMLPLAVVGVALIRRVSLIRKHRKGEKTYDHNLETSMPS